MSSYPQASPSPNFSWAEAEITNHRNLDNRLPPELYPAVIFTAQRMEAVRSFLESRPIIVSSWYRCRALNFAIGSNPETTQHAKGEAVDFICPSFGSPQKICQKLIKYVTILKYDQLIFEHSWVHISFPSNPSVKNRGQTLTLLASGKYALGITDKQGNPL
jgi:hypothetical protein